MDGTTLDLSNRGLKDISEVQQMLSSYSSGIETLNLSGNYLKYVSLIFNTYLFNIIFIGILMFKYHLVI